jgi:Pilin (bacterial filament)
LKALASQRRNDLNRGVFAKMKSLLLQFLIVLAAVGLGLFAYDHFKRPEVIAAKAQAEALRQQAEALQQKLGATNEAMQTQAAAMKQQTETLTEQATALKSEVAAEHHVAEMQKQRDMLRSYLGEGWSAANQAKTAVAEAYQNSAKMPASNHEAGLPEPAQFKGRALNGLEVSGAGIVTLTYVALDGFGGGTVHLVPDASNPAMGVSWQCISPSFVDIASAIPQCEYRASND